MLFRVVVLPAPFRPKRQTISPGSKWELYVMDADGSKQRPVFETALDSLKFEYGFVAERMVSWAE